MTTIDQQNNKRIAKNTLFLYLRMLITLVIALFTSRIVLRVLGVSDYGLYNVVGGIVGLLTVLNTTLAGGTQRFMSFAIGERNKDKIFKTFSVALVLHVVVSFVFLILTETIGLWFLYYHMNIPSGRMTAAFWVYQFSVVACIVGIIQVPFMSCLIAHEKMGMYAYMSIYDVSMKLLILFLIQLVAFDKLILYAALVLIVNVTSTVIYNFYCRYHFEECTFHMSFDKLLAKQMLSFTGWDIMGCSAVALQGEGVNIILNIFCGTIVNAARGIAFVMSNAILGFISSFQVAVNPQIVKMYAAKEMDKLYRLVMNNCRIAGYLFIVIAIPAYIEVKFVLHLWLGQYPAYTPIFVRIILIQSLFQTLNRPMVMVVHATGKMKYPNITGGGVLLLILPVSYIILKLGGSPVTVFWATAIIWSFDNINNFIWPHFYANYPISQHLKFVYLNIIVGGAIMFVVPYFVVRDMAEGWARLLICCCVSLLTSAVVIYKWGLTENMRNIMLTKIRLMIKNTRQQEFK